MKKFQFITAVCAAFSSFMFGCLSAFEGMQRHDAIFIPFVVIGFVGSAVMYANRK